MMLRFVLVVLLAREGGALAEQQMSHLRARATTTYYGSGSTGSSFQSPVAPPSDGYMSAPSSHHSPTKSPVSALEEKEAKSEDDDKVKDEDKLKDDDAILLGSSKSGIDELAKKNELGADKDKSGGEKDETGDRMGDDAEQKAEKFEFSTTPHEDKNEITGSGFDSTKSAFGSSFDHGPASSSSNASGSSGSSSYGSTGNASYDSNGRDSYDPTSKSSYGGSSATPLTPSTKAPEVDSAMVDEEKEAEKLLDEIDEIETEVEQENEEKPAPSLLGGFASNPATSNTTSATVQWKDQDWANKTPKEIAELAEQEAVKMLEDKYVALVVIAMSLMSTAFTLFVAQQMVENPQGLTAKLCRCWVAIFRILCCPLRMLCCFCFGSASSQGANRRGHDPLRSDSAEFS